ncbi:UNVERIFIED_CONTAM: hypothetical protein Sradi_0403900 [Sesamum radiatum]|uniref:Tify domain-containing protein n=1 Tax=Sesamum radiatum TaxID=300843 RepID=A0AAW2W5M5_SESRA
MDSGEIVVSSIRTGMKREFAMMMKAQPEMGVLPAGRRRTTRSQSTVGSSTGYVQSANKVSRKVKGSESKKAVGRLEANLAVVERRETEKVGAELREDMPSVIESPVPQVRDTDADSIHEDETPVGETTDLRMKMSKKVELNSIPKDLLQTGLLEGLHVRYIHGSKIVTPNQFEMHAGSGNKLPPQYIFLDNGKSLRDVLNACKANLSESLESVILNTIGRSNYTTAFCINCKELIPEAGAGRSMILCDSCVLPKESDASDAQISDTSRRSPLAGPSAPASSSCPPLVLESAQISSDSQSQAKRKGKLTRKDLRMHKSVLADDVFLEGTALSYVLHGEVSSSQFEAHAGFASRRKPYMSIYTSNGVSLHQLSLELSKSRKSSTEEHDDLCSICEDGRDLNASVSQLFPKGYGTANIAKTCSKRKSLLRHMQMQLLLEESLCEKEYHVGCLKDLKKNPELGIRWRLLRGKKASEDTRVWLSGAVNIFHDSKVRLPVDTDRIHQINFKGSPLAGPSAPTSSSCPPMVVESAQISSDSQPQTKQKAMLTRKCVPPSLRLMLVLLPVESQCVGLPAIPRGISYGKYCQNMFEKEKFAEPDANALAAGRVPGVDPLEAITQRCIRVVGTLEPGIGGCAICRRHDFCKSGFTACTIIIRDQIVLCYVLK